MAHASVPGLRVSHGVWWWRSLLRVWRDATASAPVTGCVEARLSGGERASWQAGAALAAQRSRQAAASSRYGASRRFPGRRRGQALAVQNQIQELVRGREPKARYRQKGALWDRHSQPQMVGRFVLAYLALPLVAGWFIGSFTAEVWLLQDEHRFKQEAQAYYSDGGTGTYSRARRWPNCTSELLFNEDRGYWATD